MSDIIDRYLEARADRAGIKGHKSALGRVKARIGWLKVVELRPSHGDRYAAQRKAEGVAVSTARQEVSMLSVALRYGKKEQLCPAAELNIPRGNPPRERWITREEADKLLEACKLPHLRLFVILALHTAARSQALFELRWSQVDMERRVLDLGRVPGRKSRAVVPINDVLLAELQQVQGRAATPYVIEYAGARIKKIDRSFQRAVTKAELEDLTPHDLRRSSATWMLLAGVPIGQVSRYLGHSSEAITSRVYAQHTTDWLRAASKALAGGK